jgi:uncharacterized membrane protein
MTSGQWLLILVLAVGAYAVRLSGLISGQTLSRSPKLRAVLSDIPGCLLVALIASTLFTSASPEWIAAGVAIIVAILSNTILTTMIAGYATLLIIKLIILS